MSPTTTSFPSLPLSLSHPPIKLYPLLLKTTMFSPTLKHKNNKHNQIVPKGITVTVAVKHDSHKNTETNSEKVKSLSIGHSMKDNKDVPVETEQQTGVTFPLILEDGKKLNAIGLRKKTLLGLGINIYAFGIYTDNEKLKFALSTKVGKAPSKATKEIYQMVIDSDVAMVIRLVIVFSGLTMSMGRKNFLQGLGASIKKLNGWKNDEELLKKIMGETSDDIMLTPGSVIEISRLPGYTLQTKVKSEVVSTVESELLCRAYIHMYLGDDPLDKEAKENFGASLLSLF